MRTALLGLGRGLSYYATMTYIVVACAYCILSYLPLSVTRKFSLAQTPIKSEAEEAWAKDPIFWEPPSSSHPFSSRTRHATPESLFLSKAFSHSMRPNRVIPFYFKARGSNRDERFIQEDITLLTIVTSNRFTVLGKLAQRYRGPISVALHVTESPRVHRDRILDELHDLYLSTPGMSTWVDVHLILDNFDRQFNMWRNVARLFARTSYVMMLDVDFAVCTEFRRRLLASEEMTKMLGHGEAAFVVPAFEYVVAEDGQDEANFPRSKQDLQGLYSAGKIQVFHEAWEGGHNSSDYSRYFKAAPGEVYKVHTYQHAYEPYVVFKRDSAPWCDERFIGYGGNKASCLYEMYLAGMSFYVLSDDFLIHQSHLYAEDVRKAERKYNRQLYVDFRMEACFRALHRSIVMGELVKHKGLNVQAECQKIRGASSLALEMVKEMN